MKEHALTNVLHFAGRLDSVEVCGNQPADAVIELGQALRQAFGDLAKHSSHGVVELGFDQACRSILYLVKTLTIFAHAIIQFAQAFFDFLFRT